MSEMRLLVQDYCGHPFQVQLSRALARRGHRVLHLYSASTPTTPKGGLRRVPGDSDLLRIEGLRLPRPIDKRAFIERRYLEKAYGRRLACVIRRERPEAAILANTPLDALQVAQRALRELRVPWIFWLQDLIGEASVRILSGRVPLVGRLVGNYYRMLERRILRNSDAVVGITEDFRPLVTGAGVEESRYLTIPNWAPIEEIEPRPKDNPWARAQGIHDRFVFLYSGTLGFKHNPGLLLELARQYRGDPKVSVVVNSEGHAANWLVEQARSAGLSNLIVNPYQPYETISDVLGSADVLVCILEPEAGVFSVPSKVLSYHCAGRALLLAVPETNLSARIVLGARSGLVVDPRDVGNFCRAASSLREDDSARLAMGRRARAYAERNFDIETITDRFEGLLYGMLRGERRESGEGRYLEDGRGMIDVRWRGVGA